MAGLVFKQGAERVKYWIEYYKAIGANFTVHTGNYTTAIKRDGKPAVKFLTGHYRNRVFIANKMILRDLRSCDKLGPILEGNWSRNNFDNREGLKPKKFAKVINIDLSAAYPNCLYLNGLISENTFGYLMRLPKMERLPAIGMIAYTRTIYTYEKGELTMSDQETAETAPVFYWVIQQVNDLMNYAKEQAGDHYIFHWTDGIFLDGRIDKRTVKAVENCFQELGYPYKFEEITNFEISRTDDQLKIEMLKKGEYKAYEFADRTEMRKTAKLIQALFGYDLSFLHGNTTPSIQRAAGT